MPLSSSTLFRAAQLAEQIESLQKEVRDLLNQDSIPEISDSNDGIAKAPAVPATVHRSKAARGGLAPAVLRVLKQSKSPLKAADIYERLVADGYHFSTKEPKKVLQIRLYKMGGVEKAGEGLFKAK